MKNLLKSLVIFGVVLTMVMPSFVGAISFDALGTSGVAETVAKNVTTAATGVSSAAADASCGPTSGVFFSCSLATLANMILTISANLLTMAGTMFDYAVDYSLDMSSRMNDFKFVSTGWVILRDVTNLAYIFILLYIALNIILGTSGYKDKSIISKVLVTAVFVNFSLFGAKVVIDATNIAALQFYNLITPADSGTNTSSTLTSSANSRSITGHFMNLLNLQSIYGNGTSATTKSVISSVGTAANGTNASYSQAESWWRIFRLAILGTVFVLAVTVVMFAGAFMFISRTVILFFLMLFSAIAVASRALPATESTFNDWFKKLLNYAIFAPVFMGLIYIFVAATEGKTGGTNLSDVILKGDGISGLVTFFMYLAFLVGILMISSKLGVAGSTAFHGFAEKWFSPKSIGERVKGAGKMTLGAAKGLSVRTLGAGATKLAESEVIKSTLGRVPGLGNQLAKVGDATGYNALRTKREKSIESKYNYLASTSPQGRGETDAKYKTRQSAAKTRALSSIGLDENGSIKTTGLNPTIDFATKSLLGGEQYIKFQSTKAKEAQGKAKAANRKKEVKIATWDGIKNLTGNDLHKKDSNGAALKDPKGNFILDEDAVYSLFKALEGKSQMTAAPGPGPGTWFVTINGTNPPIVLTGPGLDRALNASGGVVGSKDFNQEIKEILSKATTLKNILEKEAEEAGK